MWRLERRNKTRYLLLAACHMNVLVILLAYAVIYLMVLMCMFLLMYCRFNHLLF